MDQYFDWNTYINNYEDLQKAEINTKEKAWDHWVLYGKFEGRTCENLNNFDWKTYINNYEDLQKAEINTREKACKHWVMYGKFEGRTCENLNKNNIINSNNNIIHITHNYGGGVQTYVTNMVNIYNNYNHIIINILSEDIVLINNNKIKIIDINNILNDSNLIIVHHLLYCTNDGHIINWNLFNLLIKYKKIFIVHDYFLFYNNNPNPIKKNITIPKQKDIFIVQNFLDKFNKVYFGSKNTYDNYNKYVKISNYIILNITPDIDFYNKRIYPPKKNIYNIGLLGNISAYHKGKDLASNIFKLFKNNDKYNFIVIGEFNEDHKNVKVTNIYSNNDVFKLLKQYDIDYLLYVSQFEETYSFTASIGLKTGLPIIYNNIGSYVDRFKNYENCYSFEEDNYQQIVDILNKLDNKSTVNTIKNKYEYTLYKNLPELNIFFKIDNDLCFNLDIIKNNLYNKNVCFLHFTNINNGYNIFIDQIDSIKKSGLYDKLDYIFVTLLGDHMYLPQDYKVRLIYYSNNPLEWEFPTIKRIKYFSDTINDNINILYIHTKGVLNKPHSTEWRKYLEYFLIFKNDICLNALKYYNCVGVNQQFYFDNINYKKNHFSGNFWWSKTSYIKNLPNFTNSEDRYFPEHYLIGDFSLNDPRYYLSLHHTEQDLYQHSMESIEYNLEVIKTNVIRNISNIYIKKRKIYGLYFIYCIDNYFNIVKEQINILIKSELYNKSDIILCFICKVENKVIELLKPYDKIKIISTSENLYEKYAINNYKKYLNGDYYLYYFHSKSVTRNEQCYNDWRKLCDYFTLTKWRLSVELLEYYDCVGINIHNFPKIHYSGNYWWSKSEHLNKLKDINDNYYLSPEMYVCSYPKTNKICIFNSNVTHGNTNFPKELYINKNDNELINNLILIPILNEGEKNLTEY